MSGITEKLAAQTERLTSIKDELTILKDLMDVEGEDLSAEQIEKIDMLSDEQDAVIKKIEALEKIEQGLAAKAQPVQKAQAMNYGTGGSFQAEEKGGSLLAKMATVKLCAHLERKSEDQVIAERYKNDDRVAAVVKTAVMPANSYTAGWASELVSHDTAGFMRDLEPVSVYAALRARAVALDFGTSDSIKVPRRASNDRGLSPSFVGEGGVIPVGKMALTSQTITKSKVAVISAWTNELAQMSTPQIESMVRQGILDDTAVALDKALLDNVAAVTGVRPAGLLNGVAGTASSGSTAADIVTDLKVLLNAMASANLGANPVIIMNSSHILGLATVMNATGTFMFRDEIRSGSLLGVPVITSTNVPNGTMLIVDASSLAMVNGTPDFSVSDQAALTMANADGTAPSQAGAATDYTGGALGTAGQVPRDGGIIIGGNGTGAPTGTSVANYQALSLYQTYQTAIRMILPTGWGLLRTGAVASVTGVAY